MPMAFASPAGFGPTISSISLHQQRAWLNFAALTHHVYRLHGPSWRRSAAVCFLQWSRANEVAPIYTVRRERSLLESVAQLTNLIPNASVGLRNRITGPQADGCLRFRIAIYDRQRDGRDAIGSWFNIQLIDVNGRIVRHGAFPPYYSSFPRLFCRIPTTRMIGFASRNLPERGGSDWLRSRHVVNGLNRELLTRKRHGALIRSPRRRSAESIVALQGRAPWRSSGLSPSGI
jgi:hypothetical protein